MQGQNPEKPAGDEFAKSLKRLEAESNELKKRIEREKRAHAMPIDAKLSDPNWEEQAADGRFDLPEKDDDD